MFFIAQPGDEVLEYALGTSFDISTASFTTSISITGRDDDIHGLAFYKDGTKMYIVGGNTFSEEAYVLEYSLSSAFDITTATFTTNLSIIDQEEWPMGIAFNANGSKMFITGILSGETLHEYNLGSPYSINSATFSESYLFTTARNDIAFNSKGTKMYIPDGAAADVLQFDLGDYAFKESDPNDGLVEGSLIISIYDDTFTNAGGMLTSGADYSIDNLPSGLSSTLDVSADGLTATLTLQGNADNHLNADDVDDLQFTFENSAFTGNDASSVSNATGASSDLGIDFDDPPVIYFASPLDLTDPVKVSFDGSPFDLSSEETSPEGLVFNRDGTRMFITGQDGQDVNQYSLSTPFDISSGVTFDGNPLDLSSDVTDPFDIVFNPEGTKMFILGITDQEVNQYTLSMPFDITSGVSFDGNAFSVATEDLSPVGMTFNLDGTKMFILGLSGAKVYQYSLTSPFDITSGVTYDGISFSIIDQETVPLGFAFNVNGTKMFITGSSGDDINQYSLSNPFDISSGVTFEGNPYDVSPEEAEPRDLVFNNSGTRMFVLGRNGIDLNSYTLTSNVYTEPESNDGSMEGKMILRLIGDTFVNAGGNLSTPTHFEINNLPTGLNPSVSVASDGLTATLTLSGNATDHTDSDDISDLQFTFTDAAFSNVNAVNIVNATGPASSKLGIDYFVDTTPPAVEIFTPSDNETDVLKTVSLVIDFNEAVAAGSGNIIIKKTTDDSEVEVINISSGQVIINNDIITISPASDLPDGTDLYVLIDNTAIEDLEGNKYAGITDKNTWNFKIKDFTDDEPPVAITRDFTVSLDVTGRAPIFPDSVDNGSTDNITSEENLQFALNVLNFDCEDIGENTVTLFVTDEAGNKAEGTAIITVEDNMGPFIYLEDNYSISVDSNGIAILTVEGIEKRSSDNCDAIDTKSLDKTQFDCEDVGTRQDVTLTVTDIYGNSTSKTASVPIKDNIAPVVLTKDITIYMDENGSVEITTADIDNGSHDNCQISEMILEYLPFQCEDVGTTKDVKLIISDVNGNSNFAYSKVTLLDTITPVAKAKDITIEVDEFGEAYIYGENVDDGSYDNCQIQYFLSQTDFDASNKGENEVTFKVTDTAGNSDSAVVVITIELWDQTIAFDPIPDKIAGDSSFALNATSSSGLFVEYTVVSGPAELIGNAVILTGTGKVTIRATQPGNEQYDPADPVDQTFCVNPPKPGITSSFEGFESFTLNSSSEEGNQWYMDGEILETETGQELSADASGAYSVQVTIDGCTSEPSDDFEVIITGIEPSILSENLKVYPNPARDMIYLELKGDSNSSIMQVTFYDMKGKILGTRSFRKDRDILRTGFSTRQLPAGMYLFVIKGENRYFNGRFQKK